MSLVVHVLDHMLDYILNHMIINLVTTVLYNCSNKSNYMLFHYYNRLCKIFANIYSTESEFVSSFIIEHA